MKININGVNINPEEFQKIQEEQERIMQQQYEDLRNKFDCNNAVVVPTAGGFVVVCSIDRKLIRNVSMCKNCLAYNNKVYVAMEVNDNE